MVHEADKKAAALEATKYVKDGMTLGLGTGSTARYMIEELGRLVAGGLNVRGIPTSSETASLARQAKIPLCKPGEVAGIDLTLDGADEIAPDLSLIKGGGGALLFEKIVASASKAMIVISDSSKLVLHLGAFALPVEIVSFAWEWTAAKLSALSCEPVLRKTKKGEIFTTDGGHYILDCSFGDIDDPADLAARISVIPGVVEHGLFVGLATRAITADGGRISVIER